MFKYELDSLDGLDESQKAFYAEKDGKFYFQIEGVVPESSVAGLKANHDQLLTEKKEQQRLAQAAEADKLRIEREALEEAARQKGDWQALEDSYKTKLAEKENEFSSQAETLRKQVYKLTVGDQALKLASEISKSHAIGIMTPFIEQRLTLDENNNVRVLDLQGKPSAMTIDDLKQEFKVNAMFQDIVVANNSSGGGATGSGQGGGAAKNPKEMTEQERIDLYNRDPVLFKQLFSK